MEKEGQFILPVDIRQSMRARCVWTLNFALSVVFDVMATESKRIIEDFVAESASNAIGLHVDIANVPFGTKTASIDLVTYQTLAFPIFHINNEFFQAILS